MQQQDEERAQSDLWHQLYEAVSHTAKKFGREDPFGNGDYFVVDDNYGWRRVTVGIYSLSMLDPDFVAALRALPALRDGWEIVLAVDIPGKEGVWPKMGLTIRPQGNHRRVGAGFPPGGVPPAHLSRRESRYGI